MMQLRSALERRWSHQDSKDIDAVSGCDRDQGFRIEREPCLFEAFTDRRGPRAGVARGLVAADQRCRVAVVGTSCGCGL